MGRIYLTRMQSCACSALDEANGNQRESHGRYKAFPARFESEAIPTVISIPECRAILRDYHSTDKEISDLRDRLHHIAAILIERFDYGRIHNQDEGNHLLPRFNQRAS